MRSQEAKKPRSREQQTTSRRVSPRTILDFSTSWILGFLASWLLGISPAFADPSPAPASGASRVPAAPSPFQNVSRLGESAAQAVLREGHLLSHLRGIDPFGITIRGPYKGLPPVV